MGKEFQDEQNEDGAVEPAKKGPVPPTSNPTNKPTVPDFQDDQDEAGSPGKFDK